MSTYPGALWHPSTIEHPNRLGTVGIVEHWTAGRAAGDIATLDGPNVDCQFYVTKAGRIYEFLELLSVGWHAFHTANTYCIGIEHEGSGEPWTAKQFDASVELNAFLCKRFKIPVRHVDPSGHDLTTFHGLFGHRDLSLGGERVDGNDHTDTVPAGTGWQRFLRAVRAESGPIAPRPQPPAPPPPDYSRVPHPNALRLALAGRLYAGPDDCDGPINWCARNAIEDPNCVITFRERDAAKVGVWRGPVDVRNVCRNLQRRYFN